MENSSRPGQATDDNMAYAIMSSVPKLMLVLYLKYIS